MESAFYDENDTESWLRVIGEGRHYHFGNGPEIIRELYRYIPDGARVLDCGCGWGGPGELLATERHCDVTGVTISRNQFEYIRDHVPAMRAIHADLSDSVIPGSCDVALFVQSFTHMPNPVRILSALPVSRIVIQDFLALKGYYYDPEWRMNFYALRDYRSLFAAAGWRIVDTVVMDDEKSLAALRSDAALWLAGIDALPPEKVRGHLAFLRKASLAWSSMGAYDAWCQVIFCLEKDRAGAHAHDV